MSSGTGSVAARISMTHLAGTISTSRARLNTHSAHFALSSFLLEIPQSSLLWMPASLEGGGNPSRRRRPRIISWLYLQNDSKESNFSHTFTSMELIYVSKSFISKGFFPSFHVLYIVPRNRFCSLLFRRSCSWLLWCCGQKPCLVQSDRELSEGLPTQRALASASGRNNKNQ